MKTLRVNSLDICKCFAIMFIILTHVLQRTIPHYTDQIISSFFLVMGVPIFFFISGICASYRKPLSPLGFTYDIIKRALMYMWPFVLFLILRNAFYNQFESFSKGWAMYMEYPAYGLWVLWVLAWINVFIDLGLLLGRYIPKVGKYIAVLMLIIAFIVFICLKEKGVIPSYHFLGYDYIVVYVPIFIIGYLIGDYIFKLYNKVTSILFAAFGLVGTFMLCIFVKPFLSSGYHIEDNLYIYYLAAGMAIMFYYGISTLLERVKVRKLFAFMGQFTLEAYFLHLVLLKNWGMMNFNNVFITTMVSIGLFLLCIVNTIAVVAVLYFIPFGHFLMFGRHYSFYKFENKIFDSLKNYCLR